MEKRKKTPAPDTSTSANGRRGPGVAADLAGHQAAPHVNRPLNELPDSDLRDRQSLQRQVLHWQSVAGNRAVSEALHQKPPATQPSPASRQRSPTPVQRAAVAQRDYSDHDYNTEVTTPMRVAVTLGKPGRFSETIEIKTYDDLAEGYSELGSAMFFDRDDFFPDTSDNEFYEDWRRFDDGTRYLTEWYAKKNKTEAPVIAEVKDLQKRIAEARSLALKCRSSFQTKDEKFKRELGKALSRALEAEADTKKLLRAKFLSGEGGGDSTSSFLWTMTDHLVTFGGTLSETMDLPYTQALAAGKLIPGAVTLANVVVNWSSTSPAMMGSAFEGLAALNNMVSVAGAANSFFLNPGYLVTAYVGPMLNAITGMLGKLQTQLIATNDDAVAFLGSPLYIGAEPGGEEMWNYMVTAMRASSASDIPQPSGGIFKYFDKFREQFDEAGKAKYKGELASFKSGDRDDFPEKAAAIPTESSYLIFTDVNAKQFPGWLLGNREMVWTLLYGARDAKKAKLTSEGR